MWQPPGQKKYLALIGERQEGRRRKGNRGAEQLYETVWYGQ